MQYRPISEDTVNTVKSFDGWHDLGKEKWNASGKLMQMGIWGSNDLE